MKLRKPEDIPPCTRCGHRITKHGPVGCTVPDRLDGTCPCLAFCVVEEPMTTNPSCGECGHASEHHRADGCVVGGVAGNGRRFCECPGYTRQKKQATIVNHDCVCDHAIYDHRPEGCAGNSPGFCACQGYLARRCACGGKPSPFRCLRCRHRLNHHNDDGTCRGDIVDRVCDCPGLLVDTNTRDG